MVVTKRPAEDRHVERILEALLHGYRPQHPKARIDVKRYNSVCVWIRVVDPDFARMDLNDRDDSVWDALEVSVSEETLAEVSWLVLLTPKERKKSLMNLEFEDPTPSVL